MSLFAFIYILITFQMCS